MLSSRKRLLPTQMEQLQNLATGRLAKQQSVMHAGKLSLICLSITCFPARLPPQYSDDQDAGASCESEVATPSIFTILCASSNVKKPALIESKQILRLLVV